ncbi:hypothetical protein K7640_18025 [Micromonospora sp. PLK6-60]|uniref:hypothetical protein n=1 Tax=Micromonospora sp. PLK6-60 TaxID=2873383 RepID=UPI001CA672E5|nr:hypothetical protein [Micromonospora sp. PLK6-60]MBY8873731.1 hypothetical protein [Micromonospora sp. PLK6-60]
MAIKAPVPDLRDVQLYMRHKGWHEYPPGVAGSLWAKDDFQIGVPNRSDQPEIVLGVVERLAMSEELATRKMLDRIRYFRFDITRLRAANDFKITDSIPLEAAATITSSARVMLRSSGTTSLRERGEIGNNYSRRGDKVVENARMGHTENGSFIIPVLVELPEVEEPEGQQEPMVTIERSAPEPFERRVMRTFAQSIEAIQRLIVEPAREPDIDTLIAIVERGVSREFCSALSRVLSEDAVGEFETQFSWAEAVKHSQALPQSVSIDSDAHDLVEKTAEKLRVNKVEPQQIFSGKIVELRHSTGDAWGWIKVSTIRNNRYSEIAVRLPSEHYAEAVSWHRDARPVLVEGQIQSGVGRPLIVRAPKRCHPVDETFLH